MDYKTNVKLGRPSGQVFPAKMTIVMSYSMRDDLDLLADKMGIKRSELVRIALAEYLGKNLVNKK